MQSALLALLPPAGTKFLVDYVLTDHPLPKGFAELFPDLTSKRALLLATVLQAAAMKLWAVAAAVEVRPQAAVASDHFSERMSVPPECVKRCYQRGVVFVSTFYIVSSFT